MVGRHHLVEIKRIEELTLSVFPPTHHAPLPTMHTSINGITPRESSQWEFCNTFPLTADISWRSSKGSFGAILRGHQTPARMCHSHLEKSLFAPVTNVTVWGVVVAAFPGCGVKGCRLGWRAEPQMAQPPPETTLLRPIRR